MQPSKKFCYRAPPMVKKTNSTKVREDGNKLFEQGNNQGLSPILRKTRYEEALAKYNEALSLATEPSDFASATKNIGVTSGKIANLAVEREEPLSIVKFFFKQAFENFSKSYQCFLKHSCKSLEWKAMLTFLTQKCIEEAFDATDHLPFGEKMSIKEEYVYLIEHSDLRLEYFLEIVSMYLSESVVKLAEKKDFRGSLRYLHECYRPIEEAAKAGRDLEGALDWVEETREDVRLSTCTAESLQAISIGDKIYEDYNLSKKGSKDDSAAEVMIWEVIDWYKQAVVLTRESDIEVEAMAFSRLGRVYYHALDMESKARENFTKALQLSLSLFPRTFTSDAWFKECNETLEKIQKGQVRQENEKWNEERQQYLVELEDELKDLNSKESALSDMKFLEYLYKTYPPLDERHKLIEKDLPTTKMGDQEYKKAKNAVLRKAILHYHPDRCDVKEHGEKRKVFNEEITKMLTSKYEHTK